MLLGVPKLASALKEQVFTFSHGNWEGYILRHWADHSDTGSLSDPIRSFAHCELTFLPFLLCKHRCLTPPFMHSHSLPLCWEKKCSSTSSFPNPKRVILSSASKASTWRACGCRWSQTRWVTVSGHKDLQASVSISGPLSFLNLRVLISLFGLWFLFLFFLSTELECSQEPYFHSFQWSPRTWTPKPFSRHGGHQPPASSSGQRV